MSNIIEHSDNGNLSERVIRVGDNTPISMKTYQDCYHQITGRTEQIKKRYQDDLLIDFSALEQLNHKIMQLCEVHNIVANNEVISIFHEKERKEQFTSFERFKIYNSNSVSPTVSTVIKYNFSIIPPNLQQPQEYIITIHLTSRVAIAEQMKEEIPPFMRARFFRLMSDNTAEITIDYVDYVIARSFLEAFDEWVKGCNIAPKKKWLRKLRRWSHLAPKIISNGVVVLIAIFALQAIPNFFSKPVNPEIGARFFVIYSASIYIMIFLANVAGDMIENAIDSYPILSYLNLNRGDLKLIDDFYQSKNQVIYKFIFGCFITIILGVISCELDKLI